ncbi:MAG TPA: hypothetical protein PLH70_02240 [Bacteroidales bacterium]|nr:hypothetical protein [Bacteroidales bacterium]HOH22289.1 hypothetical protein [Bacteroidales bacterium]HPB57121.1 hypothetical protein [Bacteroidales bacterium]HPZ03221.1 hypothetical protein [Bacteroidales bacterium]HQB74605.1 hypothetical protein [Bacteroidales bacterium]
MGRIIEKLRKDSVWMGIFLGTIAPLLLFGLLRLILFFIEQKTGKLGVVSIQKLLILSIIPNLFILRYYLLKLKYDLTGKGIVTVTFIIAVIFAILEFTV